MGNVFSRKLLGEGEWRGARELYELMDYEALPEPVKQMLNNYRIYVLDVRRFKEIERFRTDLRELFTFLQNIKDKNSMEQICLLYTSRCV